MIFFNYFQLYLMNIRLSGLFYDLIIGHTSVAILEIVVSGIFQLFFIICTWIKSHSIKEVTNHIFIFVDSSWDLCSNLIPDILWCFSQFNS